MRPSAQAEIAIALAHCRKPELASLAEILKSVAASFRGIRAAAIEAFRKTLKRGHGILEPVLDNQRTVFSAPSRSGIACLTAPSASRVLGMPATEEVNIFSAAL